MYLIVGLGNPGQQYAGTRHNIGFMILDYIAGENNLVFRDSRWKASAVKGVLWDEPAVLLKPQAFMNRSGTAVGQAVNFYKLEPENIIVIHDDLDVEFGRLKMAAGGGDGGHKGIRSIIEHLGTKNFPRMKIGIGRPAPQILPEKYVLGRFEPGEKEIIARNMATVSEGIRIFLCNGIDAAMTMINRRE